MRRSESKFRAVFDNALNGICLMSSKLDFLDVNRSFPRAARSRGPSGGPAG